MELIFKVYSIICTVVVTVYMLVWAYAAWLEKSHAAKLKKQQKQFYSPEQTYNALKMQKLKDNGLVVGKRFEVKKKANTH